MEITDTACGIEGWALWYQDAQGCGGGAEK